MKKTLLFAFALAASFSLIAQQYTRPVTPKALKDISVQKTQVITDLDVAPLKAYNPTVKSGTAVNEETVGESRYDLQSNSACQNRVYLYDDGTAGATWTYAIQDAGGYADRGSAYNYFDGTSWGAFPTSRIETIRTGWPSYAPWGANGEAVVSHLSGGTPANGLAVLSRATKGSGAWTENILTGPTANPGLLWPRMVTGGTNHSTMHVMALSKPVANGGTIYNGMDGAMLYYRSQDGGATWDKQHVQPTGIDSNYYTGFSGDGYAWAEPKGNTLAFVIGDNWYDLVLVKSTDNGDTWTKTVIFEHPYPKFDEATMLVLDTPTVCDGGMAVAIDDNGEVHVAFGLMRVLNDDLTDGNTSYFPFTDGIGYWKESDGPIASMNIDSLDAKGRVIGWWQDVNENDTIDIIGGSSESIGLYFLSVSGMPQLVVDGEEVYLIYSSVTEGKDNGIQNFRHLWARASFDGGETWGDFLHLTGGIIHNFDECVFPSAAANTDGNNVYVLYQADEEPGLSTRGDEDAPTDNSLIWMKIPKADFGVGINEAPRNIGLVQQNYPNPATDMTSIVVSLNRASELSLEVTNLLGQTVMSVDRGRVAAGSQIFDINVSSLNSGIYFYTVRAGKQAVTKKMIVQ